MELSSLRRRVLRLPARLRAVHRLPGRNPVMLRVRARGRKQAIMTAVLAPAPKSIWDPVHLGVNEIGRDMHVTMAERNMLVGGEPGSGKSVALQLIVAHGALALDCKLILIDGKRVELGLWRDCAERFIGPSIDDAIETMHWLQGQIDERTEWLLDHKMRKITPGLGWPVYLVPI